MTAEASASGQWAGVTVGLSEHLIFAADEHPADLTGYREKFGSGNTALVEVSCDHHTDPSQASEMTTVENRILLCFPRPDTQDASSRGTQR